MASTNWGDLWGDDPDWARVDDEDDDDGAGTNRGGGGNEDDDDDDEEAILAGGHHVIFLLDCHADMFTPCVIDPDWPDDEMTPMDAALKACERFWAAKLRTVAAERTGKRDGCGLLLYGTRPVIATTTASSSTPRDHPADEDDDEDSDVEIPIGGGSTTHVLLPLEPPGIQQYKSIRECLDDPVLGRERDLQAEYGHSETDASHQNSGFQLNPLQSALLQANQEFRRAKCVKKKTNASVAANSDDVKEIWIFTNQDNPTLNKPMERLLLRTAKDLKESEIQIVLWSLPNPNKKFDAEVLFDTITNGTTHSIITTSSESIINQNVLSLDEMLEIIDRERKKMRRLFYAPLLLPKQSDIEDSPGIMLDFYRHVRLHNKPYPRTIHQQKKKETVKSSDIVDKNTGELIFTKRGGQENSGVNRLRFFAKLGVDRVPFTPREVKEIKKKANILQKSNGLILWGFKNQPTPFHYTLEPSYFVYPNDELVKGSTKAFANLHAAMLRKGVIAVGELLTRVTAVPRLVEIHPVAEVREQIEIDSDTFKERQLSSPGMTLFILPFQEDIRDVAPDKASQYAESNDPSNIASEEAVSAAMMLMQGLKLEDVELGERFENAALTEFWDYIENVALDLPQNDGDSKSNRRYDTQVNENEVLERVGQQIENLKLALPEHVAEESGSRKRKTEKVNLDVTALYRLSKLEKATMAELKAFLEQVGVDIPVKAKKNDLIRCVDRYFRGEAVVSVSVKNERGAFYNEGGDVESMFRSNKLQKCTVAQLKTYLEEQLGEPITGRVRKDELVQRVTEYLSDIQDNKPVKVKTEDNNTF